MVLLIRLLVVGLLLVPGQGVADRPPLLVFAAASLAEVCGSLADAFTAREGGSVRYSFAGTSALARQIDRGAPAHVFISAHPEWVQFLEGRRHLSGRSVVFASNQLALVSLAKTNLSVEPVVGFDISRAFEGRLAIADPEHVPAGRYAREALVALGWWAVLQDRLAIGHSVRAAFGYVQRGACDLGIVYATDARLSDDVRVVARFSDSLHTRITYTVSVVQSDEDGRADKFVSFLTSPEARAIILASGFLDPAESSGDSP